MDLILQAGWNYVSVVNTEGKELEPWLIASSSYKQFNIQYNAYMNGIAGNYGASGMKAFLSMLPDAGICTAAELSVPQHVNIQTNPVFNTTVWELQSHTNARYHLAHLSPVYQSMRS